MKQAKFFGLYAKQFVTTTDMLLIRLYYIYRKKICDEYLRDLLSHWYARFRFDLGRRLARLPAHPSAQPCLYPCARPSIVVSHAHSAVRAACRLCLPRPIVRPHKPRPVAIATILLLYLDYIDRQNLWWIFTWFVITLWMLLWLYRCVCICVCVCPCSRVGAAVVL